MEELVEGFSILIDPLQKFVVVVGSELDQSCRDVSLVRVRVLYEDCLLYTSPSPRDGLLSRMPSSA